MRVVVTVSALHPDAEERLRDGFGKLLRAAAHAIELDGADLRARSLRRHDLAHKLVPGLVLRDALPNPAIEPPHSRLAERVPVHTQQVGPDVGPAVYKLRARE